jgi:thioredoxin 1
MPFTAHYAAAEPSRDELDALAGPLLLEFGTPWCGYCVRVQPLLQTLLAQYPDVAHLKVEDGRGRPLGRAFRVKLWPTLVLLRDGVEVERLVRPADAETIEQALQRITAAG